MLQNIRDNSQGIVAKVIVGLIICTFALFGIESIVSLGAGEDAPATVNGVEITESEVAQMVELQKRRFRAQFGENFDPSFLNDNMLRKSAVESLVEEKVLAQAAEEVGVFYSDAAIDRLILQSPEFQEAGQFDADRFDLILRNAGFTRATYRSMLRNNLALAQGRAAWQMTSVSTGVEVGAQAELDGQTRDFALIEYKLSDAKSKVVVSADEVAAYYEGNQDRFMSDELVSVQYVELVQKKLADSVLVDEDEVFARYEDMKADSESKKEYRLAHLLVSGDGARAKISKAQDGISSGQEFDVVVKEYSEDDSSKFSGGDLGFADLSIYEQEFAEAARGLKIGEISSVVETRDGLHLIKLLDSRKPDVASFDSLKDTIEEELKADKAGVLYAEKLELLKDEAFSADNLKSVATALELELGVTDLFSREGGVGISADRQVVQASFAEGVLFDGANSDVIEMANGRAVVVRLKEYKESKVKPLEQVSAQVRAILESEKAADLLVDISQQALDKVKAGEQLEGWVEYKGLLRTAKDLNTEATQKVFSIGLGNDNTPGYAIVDSRGNKILVRLDAIHDAVEQELSDEASQLLERQVSGNEFKAYKQFKIESADIERS